MYDPGAMPEPIPHDEADSDMPPWYHEVFHGKCSPRLSPDRICDPATGTPPDDYAGYTLEDWRQAKALYYGMTGHMDFHIGSILDALDDTGLAESTLVVFLSDHGDYLGDHGFCGKGYHYDSVIRTPLVYRGPGVAKGQRIDTMASVLDITPTLLEMVGVDEPEGVQGLSMSSVVAGKAANPRTAALTENDDDFIPAKMRTITTTDWKLTYYLGEDIGELYDRNADPLEQRNLWTDAAAAVEKSRLLDMLMDELLASFDVSNGRRQQPAPGTVKWVAPHNARS